MRCFNIFSETESHNYSAAGLTKGKQSQSTLKKPRKPHKLNRDNLKIYPALFLLLQSYFPRFKYIQIYVVQLFIQSALHQEGDRLFLAILAAYLFIYFPCCFCLVAVLTYWKVQTRMNQKIEQKYFLILTAKEVDHPVRCSNMPPDTRWKTFSLLYSLRHLADYVLDEFHVPFLSAQHVCLDNAVSDNCPTSV